MLSELKDFISYPFGKYFSTSNFKKTTNYPFKDHPQLPALADILCRKNHHHAQLTMDFPTQFNEYFFEALLQYLNHDNIPDRIRGIELIYLSNENDFDLQQLLKTLNSLNKCIIIALSSPNLDTMAENVTALMMHPMCRLLLLESSANVTNTFNNQTSLLRISAPSDIDVMLILKHVRDELENFHHVLIPEEMLSLAYILAKRYLKPNNALMEALLLLDSSAARASVIERSDQNIQFKPILSLAVLTEVLSNWTHIPTNYFPITKFNFCEFFTGMQQKIYGQETALSVLSHALQQMQANLHKQRGVFYSFLFAGPKYSGKKTTAVALAEQLFSHHHLLYFALPFTANLTSIVDLKLQRSDKKQQLTLKEVIQQTPYAIIMIENIEQASPVLLENLQEILTTGYIHHQGNYYQFQQTILILSTTIGSHRLQTLTQTNYTDNENHTIDLMQLVMNEKKPETLFTHHHSPPELIDELKSELSEHLPPILLKQLTITPFLPLTRVALEKIIHLHLKRLSQNLHTNDGIELGYAPEIIRYLCNEAVTKSLDGMPYINPDKALRSLYYIVEQAIMGQVDNKNRPNQLFLQLNETGQLLRCDWLAMSAAREH